MKKSRTPRRTKSPRAVQELARFAAGLAASGSYKEDVFWEKQLGIKINAQLRTGNDQNLEEALELLYDTDPAGYGEFIYAVSHNEAGVIEISSVLKINNGIIPAGYYKEFKQFYKTVVEKNLENIVLEKVSL